MIAKAAALISKTIPHHMISGTQRELKAVWRKYGQEKFNEVSKFAEPQLHHIGMKESSRSA